MKVAIMQPYFLPYIGYFSLIKHTDSFILFDTVQFIRHGWIERNRILKQNEGWLYIKVPLLNKRREDLIKDINIDNTLEWKNKILAQLVPYKKIAPNYFIVIDIINNIFEKDYETIVDLNLEIIKCICHYLKIDKDIKVFSKMNLIIEKPNSPDEWALNICKSIGDVTEYWNPPGGQSFFDKKKYDNANIELKFQSVHLKPYNQKRDNFEIGLSIIDVMMFKSSEEINIMLDEFDLI
jgi:hypothetical protein